jgi:hypothetical protein
MVEIRGSWSELWGLPIADCQLPIQTNELSGAQGESAFALGQGYQSAIGN